MNKLRRKEIDRAVELVSRAADIIWQAAGEEQKYYDNAPENMQCSEKFERAETVAADLEEAAGTLTDMQSELESSKEEG